MGHNQLQFVSHIGPHSINGTVSESARSDPEAANSNTNYIKEGLQATPNPIKFIGRVSMGFLKPQERKDASSLDFDISKLHDTVHNCHQCPLKKPNLTVIV